MKTIITLLILLPFIQLYAQEKTALFKNYTVKDGLSQNTVIRTLEDSKGYIWFCTRDGLNRFDGTEFEVYRADGSENSLTSSDVTTITEVENGVLWIGSHKGLTRYDTNTKRFYQYYKEEGGGNSLSDNCIKHILCDKRKRLWVGTISGLDLYNSETDDFERISDEGSIFWLMQRKNGNICYLVNNTLCILEPESMKTKKFHFDNDEKLFFLFEDSNNKLWVGMWSSGLKYFEEETGRLIQADLSWTDGITFNNEQVNYIVETEEDNLMLATRNGLLVYDQSKNKLINCFRSEDVGGLSENTIISLYKDLSENIWIGTYGGGVNLYTPYSNFFIPYYPAKYLQKNIGNINSIVEYKGDLWMGTDGGLIVYDREAGTYEYCHFQIPNSKTNREIKYIQKEGDKYLWISIYYCGLYLYDMEKRQIVKEIPDFPYNQVRRITRTEDGMYWIALGVDNPILLYDMEKNTLAASFPVKGRNKDVSLINVQDIYAESEYIWMGTRAEGLYRYNVQTQKLDHFRNDKESPDCLNSNHVTCIYKDKKGNLWIGTFGGGLALYDRIKETFRTFDRKAGLDNDAISSIMEDEKGYLWITTLKGISRFNPKKESFDNWGYNNGYSLLETNLHSCLRSGDNLFYVGGNNLFLSFDPTQLRVNTRIPRVIISKVLIWADNFGEKATRTWIEPQNDRIELKYDQTSFTIRYSALNYVYPESNSFAYILEGFDKNWTYIGNERSVNYTNIPPGDYIFRVKARNNDGIWNNVGASLHIKVFPPFWKTWYAYLFYLAVFIAIIILFIRYKTREERLKMDLRIKQIEKTNIETSHRIGVQMFTNFSHELRTPLTLIIAPLDELLSKTNLSPELKRPLELINKNAQRLLWLVNRLMDFRKLEAGKMHLKAGQYKLDDFVNEMLLSFRSLADKKNILLEYNNTGREAKIWFDYILLEKVFFNLLSNAFKHTPKGGYVIISAKEIGEEEIVHTEELKDYQPVGNNPKLLLVTVEDSGKGIPQEMLPKVFEAFFQAGENDYTSAYGTGIGLSLTKSIIELHHGHIWVTSEENKGTRFSFVIPLGREFLKEDELLSKNKAIKVEHAYDKPQVVLDDSPVEENKIPAPRKRYHLVVIEDNADMRNYLCDMLRNDYNITATEDCMEGCEVVTKEMPDLIISDIMTPRMNGIEFCQKVKSNIVTSHIPIILLTARVTLSQIKEGYDSLADDYIMKPFNPELLKVRIANLLANRQKLRELYAQKIVTGNFPTETVSTEDKFMAKVLDYIHSNLDNTELSIDKFSDDIGMSRVQLYRKIKAVTGSSPSKLILDIRLKKAAELLSTTDDTVTEVSYKCGFNEVSYFGKCFKANYNISPSEYARNYR